MIKDLFDIDVEMFDGYGHDNNIVFKAATTCYRSEEHTTKTPDDFVRMLTKNKHSAMLEFSIYTFALEFNTNIFIQSYYELYTLLRTFERFKYFKTSFLDGLNKRIIVVSGNGRAWIDFFKVWDQVLAKNKKFIIFDILTKLKKINPVMFGSVTIDDEEASNQNTPDFRYELIAFKSNADFIEYYNKEHLGINSFDCLNDHLWFAFKASKVSRGLTHELVRHRTFSFAQASSRYIDNSNFDFKFDIEGFRNQFFTNNTGKSFDDAYDTLVNFEAMSKIVYEKFRTQYKIRNDIIRQVLPIGISNEICFAASLRDFLHFFELRTSTAAHPEIRCMAKTIQEKVDAYIEKFGFYTVLP